MRDPRLDEDQLRAEFHRLAARHRAVHAEGARLVARGRDDAAALGVADRHRAAAQRGVVALLDRGVEGVHVDVDDAARRVVLEDGLVHAGDFTRRAPRLIRGC